MATRDVTYVYRPKWWGSFRQSYPDSGQQANLLQGYVNGELYVGLAGYDWAQIRRDLSGKQLLKFYVGTNVIGWFNPAATGSLVLGVHKYFSKPSSVSFSEPWGPEQSGRRPMYEAGAGRWDNWPLNRELNADVGTFYGNEIINGVYGGITYGPSAYTYTRSEWNNTVYSARMDPATCNLTFIVREEIRPPTTPTLNNAEYGKVLSPASNISFDFTHNDPGGVGMSGFYFRRVRDSTTQWWNGTAWQSTAYLLPNSAAPIATGNIRRFTVPAGQWGARSASNPADYWSIATVMNVGGTNYISPYTQSVQFFPSTPPTVTIQQPTGEAYRNARPIIRWSFFDAESNPQYGWIAQIVPPEAYTKVGYNPDNYTGQLWSYSGDSDSQRSVQADVTLENHKTYRAYMKVVSSPNPANTLQYSAWAYSEFTVSVEPPPPIIRFPRTGSSADLAGGFTLDWDNIFSAEGGSQQQAAFAIRRNRPAGAYEWWNGAAWVTTEFYASGGSSAYSFRPTEVINGVSWSFAVSIRDGYGLVSDYSSLVTVFGSTAPQVTLVSPPATVTSVTPTISWTMYDIENDPQQTYRIRIIDFARTQSGTIDPLTVTSVWDSGEVANAYLRSIKVPIELINGARYRVYCRILAGGVYSEWVYSDFEISLIPPALPTASVELIEQDAMTRIVVQGRDSMLSAEASRCVGDWEALSGSTLTLGIAQNSSSSGYKGIAQATANTVSMRLRTSSAFPVVSDFEYTIGCTFLTDVDAAYVASRCGLEFFNGAGVSLDITWAPVVSDMLPTRSLVTLRSPGTATTAKMVVEFQNVVDQGNKHFFFDPVVRPTTGAEWSPGGMLGITSASVVEKNAFRIVRQGLNIPMPADSQRVTIQDEEIPIGRDVQYEITMRAQYPSDVLVTAPVDLQTLMWTSGWLWISDPLRPNTARCFGPKEFGSIERPARQGKFRPIGRPDAVITRGIRALEEGSYTIITHSRQERNAYFDLIEKSEIILLRVPPDRGETEGETYYVRMEGDLPTKRVMEHRTPHREIEQSWTRQPRPLDGLVYGEDY